MNTITQPRPRPAPSVEEWREPQVDAASDTTVTAPPETGWPAPQAFGAVRIIPPPLFAWVIAAPFAPGLATLVFVGAGLALPSPLVRRRFGARCPRPAGPDGSGAAMSARDVRKAR